MWRINTGIDARMYIRDELLRYSLAASGTKASAFPVLT